MGTHYSNTLRHSKFFSQLSSSQDHLRLQLRLVPCRRLRLRLRRKKTLLDCRKVRVELPLRGGLDKQVGDGHLRALGRDATTLPRPSCAGVHEMKGFGALDATPLWGDDLMALAEELVDAYYKPRSMATTGRFARTISAPTPASMPARTWPRRSSRRDGGRAQRGPRACGKDGRSDALLINHM